MDRNQRRWVTGFFLLVIALGGCRQGDDSSSEPVRIDLWYGDDQQFGNLGGHPQRWINVLGNVSPHQEIATLQYSIAEGTPQKLNFAINKVNERPSFLGRLLRRLSLVQADKRNNRLALPGDFNVEIPRKDLNPGKHLLTISATSKQGQRLEKEVTIEYVDSAEGWPLPYTIDWSQVTQISDAVQVVDGKWQLSAEGIRSTEFNYDRIVALGDESWNHYEVSTTVTFHDFTPPKTGVNSTGVTHAAIATRWPGHDLDGLQPSVKWFPLGATGEFRIGHDLQQCRWRIFDGKPELSVESGRRRIIELGKPYRMKHRVETLEDGRSHYRVKCWPSGTPEPDDWDLERYESEDVLSGSALLIAHHTDVTFGNVSVIAVEPGK